MSLGHLIKALRLEMNLSVEALCENICTPRYMYMIENNNKIPSALIINELSAKLGISIFDYLDYMDFEKPYSSKRFVDAARLSRYERDYEKIIFETEAIENTKDAEKTPLSYEITCNKIVVALFVDQNYTKVIELIKNAFFKIEKKEIQCVIDNDYRIKDYNAINLMNYFYIVNIMIREVEASYSILTYLKKCMNTLKHIKVFEALYISITINYLQYMVCERKSESHIEELLDLLDYQMSKNNLNRIFLTYYLLSVHYHQLNKVEDAIQHFKKCVASGLSVGIDLQFRELMNDLEEDFIVKVCPNKKVTLYF